jgi:hypothetical protein
VSISVLTDEGAVQGGAVDAEAPGETRLGDAGGDLLALVVGSEDARYNHKEVLRKDLEASQRDAQGAE